MIRNKGCGALNQKEYLHELVETIISVLDARDPYTYEHSERVALLSELIARKMNIDEKWIQLIHIAAHLHDIGKVGIPDSILNKKGLLNNEEFEIMKSHPRIGYNIIKKIKLLKDTSTYILYHHERWDGNGYPSGLSGKDIPLGARIITVADTFDAMTSRRSYKNELSIDDAVTEIIRVRGSQLCPDSVDSFLNLKDDLPTIISELNSGIDHKVFFNEANSLLLRSKLMV